MRSDLSVCCVMLLCVAGGSTPATAPAAPPVIYNLGTLGGTFSLAFDVNNSGQVVGHSATTNDGASHAFLYTGTPGSGGVMHDLGTLGGSHSYGYAVNDLGQVTGNSWTDHSPGSPNHAFLYTGTPGNGGMMHDLGTLGGSSSFGNDINDNGQIAGHSHVTGNAARNAFLYTGTPGVDGFMHDLGSLGGSISEGIAVNATGQVVGNSYTAAGRDPHAFLYTGRPGTGGVMHDLQGLFGPDLIEANDINDGGQIVGQDFVSGAFLYTGTPGVDGVVHDLGDLGTAYAINATGQVVGTSPSDLGPHAFFYTGTPGADGQLIDLDAWVDANNPAEGAKWTLIIAYGISDSGWVTGYGSYNDGPGGLSDGDRAFLLDASSLVPEPATVVLFGIGLVGIVLASRRRIPLTMLAATCTA